jgi:predicted nucleic acid-binding protein
MGLVLIAKRRGLIPAARPILEMLVARGMYLSATVIEQALALVGE